MFRVLLIALLTLLACSQLCTEPQRSLYISFPVQSQKDDLSSFFQGISKKLSPISTNYTDHKLGATFELNDVRMSLSYNELGQKEEYTHKYTANVTLGFIEVGGVIDYAIQYEDRLKKGALLSRAAIDPSYFTKDLQVWEGHMEWRPDVVLPLQISQSFHIDKEYPTL